jgi:cytochrome c biogenesis protein CcmG/thiol:disulfide interchange protein DsbE
VSWKQTGWLSGALAAAVILAALGWGVLHPSGTPSSPVVGQSAPDIRIDAYTGAPVSLSAYHGRAVVVNFWASWCAPCRQEQGPLESAAREWAGRVQFLGVDIQDSASSARAYAEQAQYPYPVGPAVPGVPAAYQVKSPPETFFINAQGTVAARFLGPLDGASIRSYLQLAGVGT